jgi:hypothetical protein
MVEPAFLALTITPSIAPSSAEVTCPESAAPPWACAGGVPMVSMAESAAAVVRQANQSLQDPCMIVSGR